MSRSTFETNIYVYDAIRDTDVLTPVSVEYIYESEWPSSEDDPGEPEVFEICSIKNKNTGAEITEEDVDMEWTLEVLEKEIRGCWGDGDFFDEAYDDYEY